MPALQHDPDRPEDVDTDGEDHAADEWRYACMSRPYVSKFVKEKKSGFKDYYRKWELRKTDEWVAY